MEKMTITERINGIAFDTLSQADFDFLVERALKSVRKSSGTGVRKPTKTQVENEGLRADILGALSEGAMTASEVASRFGVSTQKVAPQLSALVTSGQVVRVKEGKVTRFQVVVG